MALQDMQQNIQHVVHLMLENRGFDHLLGWLWNNSNKRPALNIPKLRTGEAYFYGVPQDGSGSPTLWFPDDPSFYGSGPYTGTQQYVQKGLGGYCYMPASDPGEGWDDVTQQIYGPDRQMNLPADKLMRGFYLNYVAEGIGLGSDQDILTTGTPTDLPVINGLAAAYAVSDTWFASAPTETNPNRAFSLAGTSEGRQNNLSFDGVPYTGLRTIFGVLNDTNNSWKLYADYTWINGLYFTQYMFPDGMNRATFGSMTDFANDVLNDALPTFSYLEPTFATETEWNPLGNDYHPPGSVYDGETLLQFVYYALAANWDVFAKTLLIVTFDEHGGTLDHVVPPNAVPPDELDPPYMFGRYGVRVPTILISPWVPPGCVFRASYYPDGTGGTPFDHTSVLATLCKWLNIPYQNPADVGWLRRRTASAPTFEGVITNTCNSNIASVTPYNCSDFIAAAAVGKTAVAHAQAVSKTGLHPAQLEALLVRVTNYRRGDPRLKALMAQVEATCRSQLDVGRFLMRLRKRHGSVRRDRKPT
jgi:phospholipase C